MKRKERRSKDNERRKTECPHGKKEIELKQETKR